MAIEHLNKNWIYFQNLLRTVLYCKLSIEQMEPLYHEAASGSLFVTSLLPFAEDDESSPTPPPKFSSPSPELMELFFPDDDLPLFVLCRFNFECFESPGVSPSDMGMDCRSRYGSSSAARDSKYCCRNWPACPTSVSDWNNRWNKISKMSFFSTQFLYQAICTQRTIKKPEYS